jgi:hypothetical protein
MGHQAAWVIRVLSEKRRVHQETLIPILIEGVAHPSSSFTGRDCFSALTALTKLYDGPLTSWGNLEFPDEAQLISIFRGQVLHCDIFSSFFSRRAFPVSC